MSCFPKDRPEFDFEIYEYLIKKGYKFVPRQRWNKHKPSKDCYLFLGDENYIVITPYEKPRSKYFKTPVIYLNIHKKFPSHPKYTIYESQGCSLDLVYDRDSEDIKCLECIIDKVIVPALKRASYSLNLNEPKHIETKQIRLYTLKLNLPNWQSAIDFFYEVIVPIIDKALNSLQLKCPNCGNVIRKITDEEFEVLKQKLENQIREKNCRDSLQNRQNLYPLNLILYGPPGTGKTYYAISYAIAVVENKPVDEILEESIKSRDKVLERYKEYLNNGQIVFTTFHPSYSYEDFIEGLKAKVENGQVVYYIEDGIFKEIVKRAKANPDKNYVIIIDEINRGNIPSIFGELITLIEEDKREGMPNAISVKLPYSKEDFSIPRNLYILECLNKRIEKNLDRNKTIGHAYFLSFANQNQLTLTDLNKIFKNKIIPLLQEYFYDNWEEIREVLNDKNTGYFIEKDKSSISDKLNNLSLKEDAFVNIYQNCENAGNNQV